MFACGELSILVDGGDSSNTGFSTHLVAHYDMVPPPFAELMDSRQLLHYTEQGPMNKAVIDDSGERQATH